MNPNHPVVQEMREQWYKIAAILLRRLGGEAIITDDEIAAFASASKHNIVIDTRGNTNLRLSLVDDEKARELARKEGGLAH